MKKRGRTRLSISFSSSWLAWPETCTSETFSWIDLGAAPVEVVDQVGDGPLVAGDDARGEDDRIALLPA